MFIAMNRFRIAQAMQDDFETLWRERESFLDEVAGFRDFHLLKGEVDDEGGVDYVSHSTWDSRDAFEAWMESDSFRKAHANAKPPEGMHLQAPKFSGYEVLI